MNAGDTIGSYQLATPIDADVSGAWRVKHMVSNQVFRMDLWPIEKDAADYVQAMKQVASFRHPHASPILEFGVHGETYGWALSQFPDGESLSDRLVRQGQPAQRAALEIAFAVSRALEMAHDRGFSHGRVSGEQIFELAGKTMLVGWGHVVPAESQADAQQADLAGFAQIVREITPSPPAAVRSLLESPPKTAGAFRRALSASLGALAPVSTRTLVSSGPQTDPPANHDDTMESVLPNLQLQKLLASADGQSNDTAQIDPVAKTGEHNPKVHKPEFFGSKRDDKAPSWLDVERDEVKTSNLYAGAATEEGWGIDMPEDGSTQGELPPTPGPKVHTLSTPESARSGAESNEGGLPRVLIGILVACVIVGALSLTGVFDQVSNETPASDAQSSTEVEDPEKTSTGASSGSSQPALNMSDTSVPKQVNDGAVEFESMAEKTKGPVVKKTVEFSFFPHEVTVTRVHDKAVICTQSTACRLPIFVQPEVTIDTHYSVSCDGCQPHLLEGQTVYDRRRRDSDRRVVIRKKNKNPRDRRRGRKGRR